MNKNFVEKLVDLVYGKNISISVSHDDLCVYAKGKVEEIFAGQEEICLYLSSGTEVSFGSIQTFYESGELDTSYTIECGSETKICFTILPAYT